MDINSKGRSKAQLLPVKSWRVVDNDPEGMIPDIMDFLKTFDLENVPPIKDKQLANELVTKARNGCRESLDLLTKSYARLVVRIAKECKLKGMRTDINDLIQEGLIGVVSSVMRTYDPSKGSLTTNIFSHIYGNMLRYEKLKFDLIHVPINPAYTVPHVTSMSSLVTTYNDTGNISEYEPIDNCETETLEDKEEYDLKVQRLYTVLNQLDERTKRTILLRYQDELKLSEIAKQGITADGSECSRERARQLVKKSLGRFLKLYNELYPLNESSSLRERQAIEILNKEVERFKEVTAISRRKKDAKRRDREYSRQYWLKNKDRIKKRKQEKINEC